jgi:proteic killer suppression protein
MIKSFKHKGLGQFFYDDNRRGIQPNHADKLEAILDLLDAADTISVMNFPGSSLHLLQPKHEQRWAVKVSGNWRVTFVFREGDAYEVNYVDYH